MGIQGRMSRRTLLAGIGATGLMAVACSTGSQTQTGGTSGEPAATAAPGTVRAPEANAKRGGTLRITGPGTVVNFDIYQGGASPVLMHMYSTLVRKNPTDGLRTVIPDLASSWEISTDGRTYTFRLRDNVRFHDGTPFTSADVVATFTRILTPPAGVTILQSGVFQIVERVEATDPRTVTIRLKAPAPYFLEMLTGGTNASQAFPIYSKKALDENQNDLRRVVAPGTGAFKLKEHRVGEYWVFERNTDFWDKALPYVDAVQLIHVATLPERGTAVLTDRADMTFNTAVDVWKEAQGRGGAFTAVKIPSLSAHTAHINNERRPFTDVRVRRAIFLAINRQSLVGVIGQTENASIGRWMPPSAPMSTTPDEISRLPGYRSEKAADLAEARRLLSDAGFPNGAGLQPIELLTSAVSSTLTAALQEELRQALNIQTRIRTIERALLTPEYRSGSFDILVETQFQSTQVDPTPLWNNFLRSKAPANWSRYSSAEFDRVLDQIMAEPDEAKRKALFAQGAQILDRDAPFLTLGFTEVGTLLRSSVKGLSMDKRIHNMWAPVDTAWLDK
ncbi:MAG: ABC transporter substrate-binding protein [Chloroflexi bacterium]|nr:ABC transporter substrate-binding protein [Chloroflexota bacterium]